VESEHTQKGESYKAVGGRAPGAIEKEPSGQPAQPPVVQPVYVDVRFIQIERLIPMDSVGMIKRPANGRQQYHQQSTGGNVRPNATFGFGLFHDFFCSV
jgi:hypothetical protein